MAINAGNNNKTARIVGKPFEKGKSGNPSGRPKINPDFKKVAEEASLPALEKAIEILNADTTEVRDKLRCIEIILDRGIGKAIQETVNRNINSEVDLNKDYEEFVKTVRDKYLKDNKAI